MGLQKLGITLAEQCARYAKACGKSSILCTKPVQVPNIEGLRYVRGLTEDVVQLNRAGVKTDTVINKLFDISRIEVVPNANKRALTEVERASKNTTTGRNMIMWLFSPDSTFILKNYSHPDEYIRSISKILEETKGLEHKEYMSILERLSKQLEKLATSTARELPLSNGMSEVGDTIYRYQAVQNIKDKHRILNNILQEMKSTKINDNESFSCYIERIYSQTKQAKMPHVKINYSDIDIPPERIMLSNKEKEEFRRLCLENNEKFNGKLTPDMSYEEIADKWCELRVSDYVSTAEAIGTPRMQMAALQTLPRYSGEIGADGQVQPLVRWLHTCPGRKPKNGSITNYNYYKKQGMIEHAEFERRRIDTYPKRLEKWKSYDTDKYVNETFKIGETYSYPQMQSTSTSLTWSEGVFRDDNPGMNIKFIIHPRSKTSKAYYMGSKSIGDGEAVYLPDTKFTVLDKRVERAEDSVGNIFYRHIIEMQEL